MPQLSRRAVLTLLAGGATFSTINAMPANKKSLIPSSALGTYQEIYIEWMKQNHQEPWTYIRKRLGGTQNLHTESIKKFSQEDFRCGRTMLIKGFVLSEFETAVMAALGASNLS